ncbi:ATP-binding cassette domain-containing protein [Amycolatopsis sulphurea]|uniref:ATP-binding cassette domain-containing protein n=1 Tax=Amycolatopsis sulphurea TaxID=76022 RepID=UPI001FE3E66C|nr:ATP-binding cassette domain-containing protein [Amycolatopsis sulphurea]
MNEPEAAVRCAGVRHAFGTTRAVDGVDLEIRPGEVFGLLGPNGAGKTTTIRVITTLLTAEAEQVSVFGIDVTRRRIDVTRRRMAVRRRIGYVPQQLSADGALTGRENATLFARLFDVPRAQRTAQVRLAGRYRARAHDRIGLAGQAGAMTLASHQRPHTAFSPPRA